jgi:hypothetical protein
MHYQEQPKHYLHISAFPCKECRGPVIAGWIGARYSEIEKEMEITPIGLVCLWCGGKPEATAARGAEVHCRPLEWEWVINRNIKAGDNQADILSMELSQDADTPPMAP